MLEFIKHQILHGGDIYKEGKVYNLKPEKIIDFSVNINPLRHPCYTKDLLLKNIEKILSYPDCEAAALKKSLAPYIKTHERNILIGNGSIDLIFNIVRTFDIKKALIFGPTFSEYERAVILNNGKAKYIFSSEKDNFKFNLKRIKINKNYDAVFIANPNNPTDTLILRKDIIQLLKRVSRKTLIIIDEVFMDFVEDSKVYSLVDDIKNFKNLIILRSLTKFFSIPGLRVGYIVASKDLVGRLGSYRIPWSVNVFAQVIGERLTRDKEFIKNSKAFIKKESQFLFNNLSKIPFIKPFFPNSNFILCKIVNKPFTSKILKDILAKRSVLIRDCSNFKGLNNKFFRVAVKDRPSNLIILREFKKVFS